LARIAEAAAPLAASRTRLRGAGLKAGRFCPIDDPRRPRLFQKLVPEPTDALLNLSHLFRADPRSEKIDLGVGVFRDDHANTPILRAVKEAEHRLHRIQSTKSYISAGGDDEFVALVAELVFGVPDDRFAKTVTGLQTPGGTAALRIACDLVAKAGISRTIWLPDPTWINYRPIAAAAGLKAQALPYYDARTQHLAFDAFLDGLHRAGRGDAVVLQGCCHNPTGVDFELDQWRAVAAVIASRGLLPVIDIAYQGLGRGVAEDVGGAVLTFETAPEAILTYTCSKNFGLYRERTGALFAKIGGNGKIDTLRSNLLALARANYSMPPDHGASLVRLVLGDPELRQAWREELSQMRHRIVSLRHLLADAARARNLNMEPVRTQKGMFSIIPLDRSAVSRLREEYGVYLADSGRINVAGLNRDSVAAFVSALVAVQAG
jgi:aromatic-amino-acid transaminase